MWNSYGRISFSKPSDSGGFFSNYFSVLSSIGLCVIKQSIPYVDSTNTWFNPTCDFKNDLVTDTTINPWEWWFIQNKQEGKEIVEIGLDRSGITHNPREFTGHPNLPIFRRIARDFCKIQPHILDEEAMLYERHIERKVTLGILARGTEMLVNHLEYPKAPAEAWPEIIKYCLNQNPDINNIFLVSDDRRIIESVLSAYPQTQYLENFFRSGNQSDEELADKYSPWWLFSPTGDPNHRKRIGEESLIQTRLLSKCPYFVGSYSGMSNAVNFFREVPFKANYLV
jgi:hypothetical protein